MNSHTMLGVVHVWFSEWQPRWAALSVQPELKLPSDPHLGKLLVTFDAVTHVASLTVWEGGTLEFIVLDVAARHETVMEDHEFTTAEALGRLLNECAQTYRSLLTGGATQSR